MSDNETTDSNERSTQQTDDKTPTSKEYRANRRRFLGGVTGAMAAAAYTGSMPETVAGQVTNDKDGPTHQVKSPDGSIVVTVDVSDGIPVYAIEYGGTRYLKESALGFDFRNQPTFGLSLIHI